MPAREKIRILSVEDHPVFRQGLATIIETEPDMFLVGHAANAAEAMTAFRNLRPNGHLLLITAEGFIELDDAQVVPHPELAARIGAKLADVFHVMEDSHGNLWYSSSQGVARRSGAVWLKLPAYGPEGHGAVHTYEDAQGNLWVTKAEGLSRATAAGLDLVFPKMQVRALYGDRDGALWVGTNGDGLYRFKDRTARMITTADGLPNNVIMTVFAAHDGSIWTGANCGGLTRIDGARFRTYAEKDGLFNSCVWALAEDANHDLWIGTWGGGAFRFHDGRFTQVLAGEAVTSIVAARDGSMWFATRHGVARLRSGEVRMYPTANGLSENAAFKVFEDRAGRILTGNWGVIDVLVGDRFESFPLTPKGISVPMGEDRSVRSKHKNAMPLIVTHGWPGSITEQMKIIAPLTDPTAFGGRAEDAFDVVIPSIPGYGFSGKPTATGWDPAHIARAWIVLMKRLGYTKFVAQGGDWGAVITENMALLAPPELLAIHTNMPGVFPQDINNAAFSGAPAPPGLSADEKIAYERLQFVYQKGIGYGYQMGLRPQTLYGIADSPVGLAAYFLDHDARSYALIARVFDGQSEGLTRDDILDNITLTWLPNTALSGARLYWEYWGKGYFDAKGVTIPVAVSVFPDELYPAPRSWTERAFPKLIYFNILPKGGHFAAWEQPQLFVSDVRAAFKSLR